MIGLYFSKTSDIEAFSGVFSSVKTSCIFVVGIQRGIFNYYR
ncbi:MAG: hypothetical protein OFPI_21340 [Osedax symbiont Rs2]|nr:MAG: hypothetical protein OFPI_21340 [Osedax symbiont Rs2]